MDTERTRKEDFGEAELGEAQAENPPEDPEMIDGTAGEPGSGGGGTPSAEDIPPLPPKPAAAQAADEGTEAAGAEAAEVGGHTPSEDLPPEERAVIESGGGQAEGFELAEQQLQDSASHRETSGHPLGDRFPAEEQDPEAHTIHGEADEVDSSETEDETT